MTALDWQQPPSQMSDEEVVRRVVAGETAMFEILMRRYNQRVYRVVRSIVRDDAEAEDVMQQAYMNAFVHLKQFEVRSRFSTWLTRIAINEALARVRRREMRAEVSEESMQEIAATHANPEEQATAAELRGVVEREIATLPEAYRTVLMLREVEGLSTSEAADCLDTTEDVIKTRLHRARNMLREKLYERVGFHALFPFMGTRCDDVVAKVMARLSS
ncbi:MAG TPA: RNA polymerase sigma factor [Thermoanaerobaculia bacterium]|nr:RNA polymerase sigma factor [Thermoanaerobaculia bacterium]